MTAASAKDLFVLGRISLRPTYGHEIMRTLRESHADLWHHLSGTTSTTSCKLARENLVSRPTRTPAGPPDAGLRGHRRRHGRTRDDDDRREPRASRALLEFDVLLGMVSYTDALDDAAKDEILKRRRDSLEATLDRLTQAAADPADTGEVGGFPAIILARVTQRLSDELEWLDEITSEVSRLVPHGRVRLSAKPLEHDHEHDTDARDHLDAARRDPCTVAVFSERAAGILKPWHLGLFWLGLVFDTFGTTLMSQIAAGGNGTSRSDRPDRRGAELFHYGRPWPSSSRGVLELPKVQRPRLGALDGRVHQRSSWSRWRRGRRSVAPRDGPASIRGS